MAVSFVNVTDVRIPQGDVTKIAKGSTILWEKKKISTEEPIMVDIDGIDSYLVSGVLHYPKIEYISGLYGTGTAHGYLNSSCASCRLPLNTRTKITITIKGVESGSILDQWWSLIKWGRSSSEIKETQNLIGSSIYNFNILASKIPDGDVSRPSYRMNSTVKNYYGIDFLLELFTTSNNGFNSNGSFSFYITPYQIPSSGIRLAFSITFMPYNFRNSNSSYNCMAVHLHSFLNIIK